MSTCREAARSILLTALALAGAACSKQRALENRAADAAASVPADAGASSSSATPAVSPEEGRALVKNACLSCHSDEMLAQQRLTPAQWTKVVTKMVSWGANLEPNDTAPLIAWLSATYTVDAGTYIPAAIPAAAAPAELAPLPDGPFANGDPERGRPLYVDKCSGCHGPYARGHIGVLLVDRPFLYRASEVAETIRRGRGKMTPMVMSDADIADILAHLRSLKSP
jgi:mono/diheme cytochrome c family protein